MEPPQGAGEKRISEPHKEAGSSDGIHAFGTEPQRLHEQNLDKTIDNEIAAWSVGERLLGDRVHRSPKPSRRRIASLDMDNSRQQTAEQGTVDGVQLEIAAELLELRFEIGIGLCVDGDAPLSSGAIFRRKISFWGRQNQTPTLPVA